jgi:ABC-type transporter Mla subunit MlaD
VISNAPIEAPSIKIDRQALNQAHEQIRAALKELRGQLAASEPVFATLTATRMKLGRANRARSEAMEVLLHQTTRRGAIAMARATSMQTDLRRFHISASSHIARWGCPHITADWQGYRDASLALSRATVAQMTAEILMLDEIDRLDHRP